MHPNFPHNTVADNMEFRVMLHWYFERRLLDADYVKSLRHKSGKLILRVVGEIDGMLAFMRSARIARLKGRFPTRICIWKTVGNRRLQESTWKTLYYQDVSGDERTLKIALQSALKTALRKALSRSPQTGTVLSKFSQTEPPISPSAAKVTSDRAKQLCDNEDVLVIDDICAKLHQPGTSVIGLFSLRDEDEQSPANACAAERISDSWCMAKSVSNHKTRFVYHFDATDPAKLASSYFSEAHKIKSEHGDKFGSGVESKKAHLDQSAAALEFLTVFQAYFPHNCEALLIYSNVPNPSAFINGFFRETWQDKAHCQRTIRGILLCINDPMYLLEHRLPIGKELDIRPFEWKRNDTKGRQTSWWDRLPPSNLPPAHDFYDAPDLSAINDKLRLDGRAFCIVGNEPSVERDRIANLAVHRWESSSAFRFTIWLDSSDESRLRNSYLNAIRQITFSSLSSPLVGNSDNISTQNIADCLLALLKVKRERSKQDHRWVMIFANANEGLGETQFHSKFFSGNSNWWNSRGRFVITSRDNSFLHVERIVNGVPSLARLPFIMCKAGAGTTDSIQETTSKDRADSEGDEMDGKDMVLE